MCSKYVIYPIMQNSNGKHIEGKITRLRAMAGHGKAGYLRWVLWKANLEPILHKGEGRETYRHTDLDG